MELTLNRNVSRAMTTIGTLLVNGVPECITLEDMVRYSGKVYGETAIPAGRYKVTITFSQRFQKDMMLVNDVPNFTGIRIHSGNTKEDTKGCIIVGTAKDSITRIRGGSVALPVLFSKVKAALDSGEEVWITIKDGVE